MQHLHSSSPGLVGVSAQHPPSSQLIRTESAPVHGLCFCCAEGPSWVLPKGQLPPFPCWKGAGWAVAHTWPAVQVAWGQRGAPQQTLARFWHHLLCKTVLFCSTDGYIQVTGQYLSQSGLDVMLCSVSVQLLQLHLSTVTFYRLSFPICKTQMLPPVEEAACGGWLVWWRPWCGAAAEPGAFWWGSRTPYSISAYGQALLPPQNQLGVGNSTQQVGTWGPALPAFSLAGYYW